MITPINMELNTEVHATPSYPHLSHPLLLCLYFHPLFSSFLSSQRSFMAVTVKTAVVTVKTAVAPKCGATALPCVFKVVVIN